MNAPPERFAAESFEGWTEPDGGPGIPTIRVLQRDGAAVVLIGGERLWDVIFHHGDTVRAWLLHTDEIPTCMDKLAELIAEEGVSTIGDGDFADLDELARRDERT